MVFGCRSLGVCSCGPAWKWSADTDKEQMAIITSLQRLTMWLFGPTSNGGKAAAHTLGVHVHGNICTMQALGPGINT